jgi:predicted nucleotide-binding protein (sugar kinase/HSP70/actin superfamily)
MVKVGIPRALLYYQYYPMWKTFFEGLGAEVVISPPTTQATLSSGSSRVVADTCMPEIVAQNIMPSTKENIPVLTILCDEQLGKPGMLTRLEAFVDLLKYRRDKVNV